MIGIEFEHMILVDLNTVPFGDVALYDGLAYLKGAYFYSVVTFSQLLLISAPIVAEVLVKLLGFL